MNKCRECEHEVSENAVACPGCGAPYPARPDWDGWGYEYKTKTTFLGLPLMHVSFKFRPNKVPVPARGIISIGQFGIGIINISQFGIGVVTAGQFSVGAYALAQFAAAYSCIAQVGVYVDWGWGQVVYKLADLL